MINQLKEIKQSSFFNFFIYSDTGSCIYKLLSEGSKQEDIGAMQGIIQALFFSSSDQKCNLSLLSTQLGALAYRSYQNRDSTILFALIFPNYYSDESLCKLMLSNLIDFIFHALVIHIGITDLFSFKTSNDIEKLRRYLEIYEQSIIYLLNNHSSLSIILRAEKKFELEKDNIYSLKFYLEKLKTKLKVDLICLTVKNTVVWASSDWLSIDISDRIIFVLISELYGNYDYNEIPIYFASTPLEDEGLGKIPYKLFSVNLMKDIRIIILSDNDLDIGKIDLELFDDFFVSRLIGMKNITLFKNEIIDQNAKSVIVYNDILKTYKIMIDESEDKTFERFILNNSFSDALFNMNMVYNEFYIKDSSDETFYYYKIGNFVFLILFDKDTTFDDINSVKLTLKNLKDNFDSRDNYKDTTDLNK